MKLLKKEENNFLVYENEKLGKLVAIEKEQQKLIKNYWKKYKGKSDQPDDVIKGFPFEHEEEQDSLRINFKEEESYLIKELNKFD